MQYINVFQVFFPFHLMISWHFLTDWWFWIALWTLSYDMWMENFRRNSVPLLRKQRKNILGWGGKGWSKKCFINKMFPNKPKNYVEYFFIMYHQNACSRGLRISKIKMLCVWVCIKFLNLKNSYHTSSKLLLTIVHVCVCVCVFHSVCVYNSYYFIKNTKLILFYANCYILVYTKYFEAFLFFIN